MSATEDVRAVILLPTYNERENLDAILDAALAAQPQFHVLVIDDSSPDGTGEIADRRAEADDRIFVLHRAGKEGLGKAYVAGFRWALDQPAHYTHIFEMDADFSHDPKYLGPLLDACREGADLAVGSRYVPGGDTIGWGPVRKLISRGGGVYAGLVLGVDVRDLTTGYKCFSRHVLEAIPFERVLTVGYGFQVEMTYRALRKGFEVAEVPILFPDRQKGASKMSLGIFLEAFTVVWRLRFARLDEA